MRIHYPTHSQLYIGQGRTLYCGPLQHLETHLYGSAVLHLGIYRPFRIKLADGEWRNCRCALVPPGVRHALDMDGGVHGKLFVELDSPSYPGFRRRFPYRDKAVGFFEDAEAVECFRWVFEENPGRDVLESRLDALLGIEADQPALLDPRILRVIELMGREADRNHSQAELAAAIALSPSRFQHLFRQELGVPCRRFRLWRRVLAAIKQLHAQDNMTRAALEAGFADATHFSHCFRDTFGVNPAFVFRSIHRFEAPP